MKISQKCYAITGLAAEPPWAVNAGFIVGDTITLIVDTGSNYLTAQSIFGYAHSIKSDNSCKVVNTELHFDHIGGNCFFRAKNIDIHAHPGTQRTPDEFLANKKEFNDTIPDPIRRSKNESDAFFLKTDLENPNRSIAPGNTFDLGGVNVDVIASPGHTRFNLSFFAKSNGVLFSGDCIVSHYLPYLGAVDISAWEVWLQSLDRIEDLHPKAIVPGHGDIIKTSEIGKELDRMRKILTDAINDTNRDNL